MVGEAEDCFEIRKKIFDDKYQRRMLVEKIAQEIKFEELKRHNKKRKMEENQTCEHFINKLQISGEIWLIKTKKPKLLFRIMSKKSGWRWKENNAVNNG